MEEGNTCRRLRDAEGFTWLPGMLACRWAPGCRDHLFRQVRVEQGTDMGLWEDCVPDMRDAATLGVVEHGLLTPRGWVVARRKDHTGALLFRAVGPNGSGGTGGVGWSPRLAEVLVEAVLLSR
jgi:hypothetical protein